MFLLLFSSSAAASGEAAVTKGDTFKHSLFVLRLPFFYSESAVGRAKNDSPKPCSPFALINS